TRRSILITLLTERGVIMIFQTVSPYDGMLPFIAQSIYRIRIFCLVYLPVVSKVRQPSEKKQKVISSFLRRLWPGSSIKTSTTCHTSSTLVNYVLRMQS